MDKQLYETTKKILGTLLADFSDRELTAKDLKNGYKGPNIKVLATAVCNTPDITTVDFEIAFSDLEKSNMIRTGPMVAFENNPGETIIVIGSYSKREFANLTEVGYKVARTKPNRPEQVQRVVNNLTITGGQFSNIQLGQGENFSQSMSNKDSNTSIIIQLIKILESYGIQATDENKNIIELAVKEASYGNGGTSKSLLTKIFGETWEIAKGTVLPITNELIKKSMGL